jgi:hypothetical protein
MILKIANYGDKESWHMVDRIKFIQWTYILRSEIEPSAYSLVSLPPPAEGVDEYFCSCHFQREGGTEWTHIAIGSSFLMNDDGHTIERL